jgi:hypothetical protein
MHLMGVTQFEDTQRGKASAQQNQYLSTLGYYIGPRLKTQREYIAVMGQRTGKGMRKTKL